MTFKPRRVTTALPETCPKKESAKGPPFQNKKNERSPPQKKSEGEGTTPDTFPPNARHPISGCNARLRGLAVPQVPAAAGSGAHRSRQRLADRPKTLESSYTEAFERLNSPKKGSRRGVGTPKTNGSGCFLVLHGP